MAPGVDCILDITSNLVRLLNYEKNGIFLADSEALSFKLDPFHESTTDHDDTRRDCTPAPQPVCNSLRITMSSKPTDSQLGWVFGSDVRVCDVLLDTNMDRGISAKQFAVRMQNEPGVFLIVNLSRHGTLMRFTDSALTLVKTQRAFGASVGMRDMVIRVGDLEMHLSAPDHSAHLGEFEANWSQLYAEFVAQVPHLTSLAMSSGTSTTHPSIEYYFNGELGRGDGGRVYRAVNRVTGEVYAVKHYWSSKDVRKEAALLSRIQHDHIVKLHSFKVESNELVLEYIRGLTVRQEQAVLRFTMLELKIFSKQCLDALSYLHGKGITHRDLKLDNVVLQSRSPFHIKLIDFNVSSDAELMKTFAGTHRYMAPEVAKNLGSYDSKADVWSLGMMIMELFCGLPRLGSSIGLHLHLCLKGKQHGTAVPFISHLLSEWPVHRPTAQEALCLDFLDFEEGDAATALPPLDANADTSSVDTNYEPPPLSEHLPDIWPCGTPYPSTARSDNEGRKSGDSRAERRQNSRSREYASSHAADNGCGPARRSFAADPGTLTISDLFKSELCAAPTPIRGPDEQPTTRPSTRCQAGEEKSPNRPRENEACTSAAAGVMDSPAAMLPELPTQRPELSAPRYVCQQCTELGVSCPVHNLRMLGDIVYVVYQGQRVSMRIPEYCLNATEICKAAGLDGNARRTRMNEIRQRARIDVAYTVGAGVKQSWVPFQDGVFLCQSLGMEYTLDVLFSQAPYPLPSADDNYLT